MFYKEPKKSSFSKMQTPVNSSKLVKISPITKIDVSNIDENHN